MSKQPVDATQITVQKLVEIAHRLPLEIEDDTATRLLHCTDHAYTSAGLGSNTLACLMPGK